MRRVLDFVIGFISPYTLTQVGITRNYSAIADVHTL
jgi:hypothetical protein